MLAGHEEHKIDALIASDPRWTLVERIASSPHLRTSFRLREFLFYVAECAIRDVPGDATEQQIGIRVFGRSPGYNSSEDSIVRTHARLLRQKMAAYFAEDGVAEEMVVDIPKGHYLPVFHPRNEKVGALEHSGHGIGEVSAGEGHAGTALATARLRGWTHRVELLWAAGAVFAVVVAVALAVWHPWKAAPPGNSAVDTFWRPFLGDDASLVIYSNAWFAGDSTKGLRYAPPQTSADEGGEFVDTYTGIGELASVYALTKLFDGHKAAFTLKRSLLVTWDEAKSRNLVFIGSRAENVSLRVLQPTTDFSMETKPGFAGVVNHHPKAGEPEVYSRPERPLTEDYAILALSPGVDPSKRILVFSGLTTYGTQAAVEYVCSPETTAELLKLITGPKGEIRPFEAVLHTTIGGGVPLQTKLVTIRVH